MIALVAALLAATPDAGAELPLAVYAERAQLLLLPGGNWVESECEPVGDGGVDCAGAWLPSRRLLATGRELADLRAEVDSFSHEAPVMPKYLLAAFGAGALAATIALTVLWWMFLR